MSWPEWLDRRGSVVALVAVWALAYLPYLGARDLRHEEGRRATPAREMLESGTYVCPTLYGDPYLNKPPLYPWLVAVVGAALGEVTPLAVRLPSALAALGTALLALRFAPRQLDRRTRALAALFVLASVSMLDKGTLGEIDPTLTLVVAAALKVWWDGYEPDRQTVRSWIGTGVLLGLAGLLKGPAGRSCSTSASARS
jgi:4-amino-4-deoxy-L-arabinose transferase-like glycosyltransferase